jgi:hypothetical protein
MFALTYVSTAVHPFSVDQLRDLLIKSRANNTKLGVTGMLLYKDGSFMQALEGEESVVNTLADKIHGDPRHKGMLTLYKGHSPERQFADWSMGFQNLNSPEVAHIPGYSSFLSVPLTDEAFRSNPGRAMKLLLVFRKNIEAHGVQHY